ncbi:hypothetical protein CBR_g39334 [Chara braunii]|uniref:Uncharacterized protein n=1 Tax=Chara braunii TaxID=69332 RepID=A0A388K174_CHABU|nr:hypothetical protein CBR_g39334 [Chara braunii]|eukprot:GBG63789.1 hypothetical protein CBR_g39334 [Chara braunii]
MQVGSCAIAEVAAKLESSAEAWAFKLRSRRSWKAALATESLCVRKGVPDIKVFLGRSPTDPSRPRTCATLKKPNLGFPLADKVTKPFQELLYVAAQLIEVSPQKLYSVIVGIEKDLNSAGQNEGEGHKEQNLVRLGWRGSADDHSDADVEADVESERGAKEANKATEFRVKQEEDVDEGGGLEAINTQNSFPHFRY